MTAPPKITPRCPRYLVERRCWRLVERYMGEAWDRRHTLTADRMMGLWEAGELHERNFEAWLEARQIR